MLSGGIIASMYGTFRSLCVINVAALLAAMIAGCGSSASQPPVPAGVASQMRAHLAQVRNAAAGGDLPGPLTALDAFAADVARQHTAGHLTGSEYPALETGIARARQRIAVSVRAPSPLVPHTSTSTTSPTVSPAPPDHGHGHGHGDDKGKGKGTGKGHGKG
ncbi:MAG: hypothetical protein ACR2OB_08625 [Solirubrobacteraceae bacterium]